MIKDTIYKTKYYVISLTAVGKIIALLFRIKIR